jgi:serine/threonine protein kinase
MPPQQQRYRIIERIAAGGMAEVYRAESAGLEGFKKVVAIKRVLPHLAEKKQFIGMFLDEAHICRTRTAFRSSTSASATTRTSSSWSSWTARI